MNVEFRFTIKNTSLEHARHLWSIIMHLVALSGMTIADGGGYHRED